MNEKIFPYIYDFLSILFENVEVKKDISEIILFGSISRGNHDKESDIDLFFNVGNKELINKIESLVRESIKSFEVNKERTWLLKKIDFPINVIVGNLEDKKWAALKEEIISTGIILYSNYKETPKELTQKYLIYYSLSELNRKDKMKFIRKLFGYRLKKKNKEYNQLGIINEQDNMKLASNVILTSNKSLLEIKKILSNAKVKYKILETWIRQ